MFGVTACHRTDNRRRRSHRKKKAQKDKDGKPPQGRSGTNHGPSAPMATGKVALLELISISRSPIASPVLPLGARR